VRTHPEPTAPSVEPESLGDYVAAPADAQWLQDFRDRYLNLHLSEDLVDFLMAR